MGEIKQNRHDTAERLHRDPRGEENIEHRDIFPFNIKFKKLRQKMAESATHDDGTSDNFLWKEAMDQRTRYEICDHTAVEGNDRWTIVLTGIWNKLDSTQSPHVHI
jgi:hypothetical protein